MPCNVLQPPSTLSSTPPTALPLLSLLLLLLLLHLLPPLVLILPLALATFALFTPLVPLPRRCSIEIQFPPSHPSHLPPPVPLSLSLHSRLPSLLLPSLHSGNPEDSRKEATGCIPRDKLRGSIIHGNLLLRLCLKTWMLFSRFHATFPRRENDIESR